MSPRARFPRYLPFLDRAPSSQTGLMLISESSWLSPDTEAAAWLRDKCLILKMMRANVVAGDVIGAAAQETLDLVMAATGETPRQAMPTPLEEAASLVSDDLCLLTADGAGDWHLTAGVLCAPTYWTLPDRIGLNLAGLHGPVPSGDPELATRVARVFTGLQPGVVLERLNWTVQASDKRYTPNRPSVAGKQIDDLHLRVERQTIRKLPDTGAMLFTIRVCLDPLLPLLTQPETREAFEDAWLGASAELRAYKHWDELEPLVATACRWVQTKR